MEAEGLTLNIILVIRAETKQNDPENQTWIRSEYIKTQLMADWSPWICVQTFDWYHHPEHSATFLTVLIMTSYRWIMLEWSGFLNIHNYILLQTHYNSCLKAIYVLR